MFTLTITNEDKVVLNADYKEKALENNPQEIK